MLTWLTLDHVGAHYHRTAQAFGQHGIRITEEEVSRGETNPARFLKEGQHRVDRVRGLGNGIYIIIRRVGGDGAAIVGKVKVGHLSGDSAMQLVWTFQRD